MASLIYDDNKLMKALLEAGVHFGHQTKIWNPKMRPYIYQKRHHIYIIDLRYTMEKLKECYNALKEVVLKGGSVLFVGTKKQAQGAIKEEALRAASAYVSKRWLGGTLTNYATIKRSVDKLKKLEKKVEMDREKMIKKELVLTEKNIERMRSFYDGIRDMKKLPDALWVVDAKREINAILEARKLGIKIFGIADTNCDPDLMDFIVPGNDDAIRAVKLLTEIMADAVIEGSTVAAKQDMEVAPAVEADADAVKAETAAPAEAIATPAAVSEAISDEMPDFVDDEEDEFVADIEETSGLTSNDK
ncbi:MAG: 30S ribosomal protein S2 [Spirochaetes bacterium GWF1_51_8]|nr:MAG: 30S ribosomal protein S2 [Spirochaetes bacterium GWF1_51_8]